MQRDGLLSVPLKLHWAGWETNTYRLQQAGWSLSAEQDFYRGGMRLGLRHEGAHMYGITDMVDFDYHHSLNAWEHQEYLKHISLKARLASNFHVQIIEPLSEVGFRPIDAVPQLTRHEVKSLDDLMHFATPLARTQEIILPEEDVGKMLERILELQQPAKTEYFKQKLRENHEGMEWDAIPRQKFHAQILSIAA